MDFDKERVYCKDCQHIMDGFDGGAIQCKHPENRRSWYSNEMGRGDGWKKLPEMMNYDNNCKWYEYNRRTK